MHFFLYLQSLLEMIGSYGDIDWLSDSRINLILLNSVRVIHLPTDCSIEIWGRRAARNDWQKFLTLHHASVYFADRFYAWFNYEELP